MHILKWNEVWEPTFPRSIREATALTEVEVLNRNIANMSRFLAEDIQADYDHNRILDTMESLETSFEALAVAMRQYRRAVNAL